MSGMFLETKNRAGLPVLLWLRSTHGVLCILSHQGRGGLMVLLLVSHAGDPGSVPQCGRSPNWYLSAE